MITINAVINFSYFLIGVVGVIYGAMSWQGTQGYNTSAKSAHEAKMGSVLGNWRGLPQTVMLLFIPIIAYAVMHNPDFSGIATEVKAALSGVESEALQNQLRIPYILIRLLPVGLMGAFTAVMLAAFISTVDSYLLTWSTVIVNDVICPLVRKPMTPKAHLWLLRIFVALIAIVIYIFGIVYKPTESIIEFMLLTGTMMLGEGVILIGGLYWKRGSTAGAYAAVIFCCAVPVANLILKRVVEDSSKIRAQDFGLGAIILAVSVFVLFSVIIPDKSKEKEQLLC